MLLAEITFGQVIWSMIWLFFLFMFIWVFIGVIADLFRDHELSGLGKAAWVVFLIVFPFLGTLIYLIVRGGGMAQRSARAQAEVQRQLNDYIREQAGGLSPAVEIEKLATLKDSGTIDEAEYEKLKAKIIG